MTNQKWGISKKNSRRTSSTKAGNEKGNRVRSLKHNNWVHDTVRKMLAQRGYHVVKQEENWLCRRAPFLSFIGINDDYETLCIKVKKSDSSSSRWISVEDLCEQEIPLLRSLLTINPGDTYLRCEIWIFFKSGEMLCIEVTQDGIRHLPHASIRPPALSRHKEYAGARPAGCIGGEPSI